MRWSITNSANRMFFRLKDELQRNDMGDVKRQSLLLENGEFLEKPVPASQ